MAVDSSNILTLSEFQSNMAEDLLKLKQTGAPTVLTVDGQAEFVIQSAKAYHKLLEDQELLFSLKVIGRSLEQSERGEGRPLSELVRELAGEHGISIERNAIR